MDTHHSITCRLRIGKLYGESGRSSFMKRMYFRKFRRNYLGLFRLKIHEGGGGGGGLEREIDRQSLLNDVVVIESRITAIKLYLLLFLS